MTSNGSQVRQATNGAPVNANGGCQCNGHKSIDLSNFLTPEEIAAGSVMKVKAPSGGADAGTLEEIEARLSAFRQQEAKRLQLDAKPPAHWKDEKPQGFTAAERARTTILFGGLTEFHDTLIEAALSSLGYKTKALSCPDNEALRFGTEFCSKGQCNPTYYTVGNLVKYVTDLRDIHGVPAEQIISDNVFVTFASCGPCRFGSYATEYRKALSDAGFDGFRIIEIRQTSGPEQLAHVSGLKLNAKFYLQMFKCVIAGDLINALGYRTRPYETEPGATDAAMKQCLDILRDSFAGGRSLVRALMKCRKVFAKVEVDRLQPKPKVSVIGEFWAMTTEGSGNYKIQRFLEAEGAECVVQPVAGWVSYLLWVMAFDERERLMLRRGDEERHFTESKSPVKKILLARTGRFVLEKIYSGLAHMVGLKGLYLTDMDDLASISHEHYPVQLRGGEGHMEVGKLIENTKKKKAHLTVSVKPFGCMPSSCVSDGIQTLITTRLPQANFLAIETTGDGAVNAHSRIQMALFKARSNARQEFEAALGEKGMTADEAAEAVAHRRSLSSALHYPSHHEAGTAANAVYELRHA